LRNPQIGALATLTASVLVFAGCASTPAPVASTATPATAVPASNANLAASSAGTTAPSQPVVSALKPTGDKVYFDYDKYDVKDQYAAVVRSNAEYLAKTSAAIELDGNADERGSREYNMALGQKRADAVKKALAVLGVKTDRIETVSFGEDKPKGTGHDEAAWAENRRVDFVQKSK
jgi:peptidoglycan-associated lipoprotein